MPHACPGTEILGPVGFLFSLVKRNIFHRRKQQERRRERKGGYLVTCQCDKIEESGYVFI